MWIVNIALRRPYTFIVAALLILLSTPYVLRKMPTDIFPEIDIPVVAMLWDYKGMNGKEIADRLTGPVELSMSLIDGIEHSESVSYVGAAVISGESLFLRKLLWASLPTSGKNYSTANAFGGPSRPASLVAYPAGGMQHSYRNDSTRFRKACIFTTQKALRENICPIASGDYSTPVSQRACSSFLIKQHLPPACFMGNSAKAQAVD